MNGTWTNLTLAGKTVEVYAPAQKPRFGLVFLHPLGLETLRDRPAYTRLLDQHQLACICPHGARSWWVDRICPEFDTRLTAEKHILGNVLPLFQERWSLSPRSIAVFGISMGGQGALRLAFKYPGTFPIAAGISSAIDFHEIYGEGTPLDEMYDSKEQCRQDTVTLHVSQGQPPPYLFFCIDPDDAMWHRGNDRLHEKLSALGVPHTIDFETQAGGHTWPYFERMADPALRFLVESLEKESRRLL